MPLQLNIITSNHLETLADALADVLLTPPEGISSDPLQPETIVVQSKGMQDWIRMALAQRNGVCANTCFPFPNTFIEQLYGSIVGPLPGHSCFDPTILAFRIMQILPELTSHAEFKTLRKYLLNDPSGVKTYRISRKVADLFDQYLVFRPDYIANWDTGSPHMPNRSDEWQAILWKQLVDAADSPHRAEMQRRLISLLSDEQLTSMALPSRVSMFGVSHLPPFHLNVLAALANRIPVYLFLLNPCRHYWSDIMSERQISRVRSAHRSLPDEQDQILHLEQGNRLLASWGFQGKQFFDLIYLLEGQVHEIFIDEAGDTLLRHIQNDILNLKDSPADITALDVQNDGTLQIHICHSPMREVEVLYDQLLFMLDSDPELEPRDILVMTPDIATYAPLIQAVFSTPTDERNAIAYSVADQNIPAESQLVEGFLQLLDLHRSRFEVTKIMHLLEFTAIRQRFQIAQSDIGRIEQWIDAANIRWGWDGHDKGRYGLPRFESNTWRQGIDRLIMGYAVKNDGGSLIKGISPYNGLDVSDGQLLGNVIQFAETVHQAVERIGKPATLTQWHEIVCELIDTFITADETSSRDLLVLKEAVDELEQISTWAPSDKAFAFEVVHEVIAHTLGRPSYGTGFLAGAVTFCAMLPMRSIPAKVICVLGMGHDQFPQESREPTFNLITAHLRAGDRSKRDDDKYLFLESLISSRKIFYISYVGRDIQDNSVIPPSVVVDELIEYAQEGFGIKREHIVVEHPLQAFSKSYFDNRHPRLFSYSQDNLEASKHIGRPADVTPFFSCRLPAVEAIPDACNLRQLTSFFSHPCRYLLKQRLGIYLDEAEQALDDRERFNLDALDRYLVSQKLLESSMHRQDVDQTYQILKAAGELPHGAAGKSNHRQLQRDIDAFIQVLNAHTPREEPTTESIRIEIGESTIEAVLSGLFPDVRIIYRMAKTRPCDRLSAFIDHLAMLSAASREAHLPQKSLLICNDALWEFGPFQDAEAVLADYLTLFGQGMRYPLNFFANASYAYADSLLIRRLSPQESLAAAARKYQSGHFVTASEAQDPYIRLCFRGIEPLNGSFEDAAIRIYQPMLSVESKQSP